MSLQQVRQICSRLNLTQGDPCLFISFNEEALSRRIRDAGFENVQQAKNEIHEALLAGIPGEDGRNNGMVLADSEGQVPCYKGSCFDFFQTCINVFLRKFYIKCTGDWDQFTKGISGLHLLNWTRHKDGEPDIAHALLVTPSETDNSLQCNHLPHLFNQ